MVLLTENYTILVSQLAPYFIKQLNFQLVIFITQIGDITPIFLEQGVPVININKMKCGLILEQGVVTGGNMLDYRQYCL